MTQPLRHHAYVLTLPMQSSGAPPDFGTETPPDATRTVRVVKDILRVGHWKTGYDDKGNAVYWDVKPETLSQIVSDFRTMKVNGVGANLGKTHGDDNLLIHPDDLIAPVDELKIAGDTLWMASYVTPQEAEYLKNPARKVSVGVIPNHDDGQGRKYKLYLTHVAVTDRPVVAGQAPFLALAEGASTGGSSMDFAALLTAVNGLLEALGFAALPDDTAEENIVDRLIGVSAAMGTTAETTEPAETPAEGGAPMPEMDMSGLPAAMRDPLKRVLGDMLKTTNAALAERDATIKRLTDEATARETAAKNAAKAAFDAKCVNVMTVADASGRVASKATVDAVKALADKCDYNLALLDNINRTIKLGGGAARGQASAEPPMQLSMADAVHTKESREAAAQRIADLRGISLADALKCLPRVAG